MKTKFETRSKIFSYSALVETQLNSKVIVLKCENGLEFSMLTYFSDKGTIHQNGCVATPQ